MGACGDDGGTAPTNSDPVVAKQSGDTQAADPGETLADPIVVRVTRDGAPLSGQTVAWSIATEPMGTFTRDASEVACLPAGEIGEIAVSGAHVLPGYLDGVGDAETKFEVDGTRWHRTGDAGYLDASGRLWLVGRCSARVEDARGTVYPFTVECAAQFVPGVARSAMVAHEGQRILLVEAVRGFNQGALSGALVWAKLDDIRVVPKIPVDNRHNAKVDYTQVKALLRANQAHDFGVGVSCPGSRKASSGPASQRSSSDR